MKGEGEMRQKPGGREIKVGGGGVRVIVGGRREEMEEAGMWIILYLYSQYGLSMCTSSLQ